MIKKKRLTPLRITELGWQVSFPGSRLLTPVLSGWTSDMRVSPSSTTGDSASDWFGASKSVFSALRLASTLYSFPSFLVIPSLGSLNWLPSVQCLFHLIPAILTLLNNIYVNEHLFANLKAQFYYKETLPRIHSIQLRIWKTWSYLKTSYSQSASYPRQSIRLRVQVQFHSWMLTDFLASWS